MKNSGRTGKSTVFGSISMVTNILLNAVFIFGLLGAPKMGIQGAAVATVIARGLELLLVCAESAKKDVVRIRWKYLKDSNCVLQKDFWHYTSPVLANELLDRLDAAEYIRVDRTAGLDMIYRTKAFTTESVMADYYKR